MKIIKIKSCKDCPFMLKEYSYFTNMYKLTCIKIAKIIHESDDKKNIEL